LRVYFIIFFQNFYTPEGVLVGVTLGVGVGVGVILEVLLGVGVGGKTPSFNKEIEERYDSGIIKDPLFTHKFFV
jgi:hypothetical protein